jgi:hypothetical protein
MDAKRRLREQKEKGGKSGRVEKGAKRTIRKGGQEKGAVASCGTAINAVSRY